MRSLAIAMMSVSYLFLSLATDAANAEVFRWKDSTGRVIYGDNPPDSTKAESVTLSPITISEHYGAKPEPTAAAPKPEEKKPEVTEDDQDRGYENFKVAAPQNDEALRSNEGSATITLTMDGALKEGDSIVLYVDGKQQSSGSSMSFSLSDMDRGSHTTFAVIQNAKGEVIQNTEVVNFHVLRAVKRKSI